MAPLFDTPGMTAATVTVMILGLLSILMTAVILMAFRRMVARRSSLFEAIEGHGHASPRYTILILAYVTSTAVIVAVTTGLYLFQPHLL